MTEEAAIEHGVISCSAMHVHGNLLMGGANANSLVSSLDTSATTKLVPNNVVRTELQARMPREYNVRVSGDFKTTTGGFATEIQDTFPVDPHGRIDNNNGVGIKIPVNGVYFSNLNLDMTSDAEETVLKLQPQGYFQLGGSASDFQQNASFSVDFEWRGTSLATTVANPTPTTDADGMASTSIPLLATAKTGNRFRLLASKASDSAYALKLECSDGTLVRELDAGTLNVGEWYHIVVSWASQQNTMSVQVGEQRYQDDDAPPEFGSNTSRPFTFGTDDNGTTTGGGFEYRYVRFHQRVLTEEDIRALVPVSRDVDIHNFRSAIVYNADLDTEAEATITKHGPANSWSVATVPSSVGAATLTLKLSTSGGVERTLRTVKISPEAAIGNRNVCQTFLAVAGDIVRFAVGPTTYVDYTTREFCVTGLKFDDIVVPRITLTQPDMVLEKGATYPYRQAGGNTGDLGFTAFEHLSPTPANAAPQPVDRSASVAISGLVDTGAVGRQYVKYTLTSGSTTVTATRSVLIIDETAPVILLTGSNNVNHERGSSYVDAGATVQEGPNVPITVVNGVVADTVSDPNAPYTVTYDAMDASGNRAVRVTRIVHVSDSTAPVIEFGPSKSATAADVTIERLDDSGAFEDVSARDPPDDRVMTVQASFLDASDTQLNPNTIAQMVQAAGSYKIIYTCSDGNGNSAAQKQRNVTVQDTTKPRIAVTSPDVVVERLNAYTSLMDGVTAHDYAPDGFLLATNGKDEATDLTSDVVVTTEAKAFDGTNTWYVTVVGGKFAFVADAAEFGNASLLRPEIALTRGVTYTFDQSDASNSGHPFRLSTTAGGTHGGGSQYTDGWSENGSTFTFTVPSDAPNTLYYYCQHHVGMGNLMHLQQNDVVFTDTAQKYQIRYDVEDVAENQADTAYRTVTIRDQTTPVITLAVQAFAITVAVDGGANKYHIDGVTTPQLQLFRGFTYTFRQADASNSGHPLRLSTTAGGTHGGGSQYTDGWSENGSTLTFTVPSDAPNTLYYYCQHHNGMGGAMTITTDATGATHDFVGSKAIERVTGSFDDPGFSASDGNVDLTSSVVITDNVDVNTVSDSPNHWHYTYTVTDSSGNSVQKHRRVQVTDSVAPTITLLGSSPENVAIGGTYAEPGVTVSEGGQTTNVTTNSTLFSGPDTVNFMVQINDANGNSATNGVETGTETTYTVTYTATDHSGNSTSVNRTVQVADFTAPVVTLLSENSNTYEVAQGDSTYVEHGARATDAGQQVDFNSNTTSGGMNLVITGPVDTTTKGTYTVTYTATDANNNPGNVTRTVSVVDTTAPVITINGDNPATVTEGDSYTDLGIAVVDNSGETVGAGLTVTTSNPVDTSNVGAYTITYVVEDSSLNQATATRTVNVESAMGVQLSGSSTLTLERYASYVEPGAALVQTITTTAVDLDTSDVVDRWPADPSIPNHSWAGPYTSSGTGQGQTLTTSSGNLPSGNEPYSFEFTLQTDGGWGSKMPFWWGVGTTRAMTLFGTSSNSQIGVDHYNCQYLVGLGADSFPSDYTGAITIRATKSENFDHGVTIMIYHSFDGGTTWHQPKVVYQSPTPNTGPTSMEATNQLHILASPWSPNYDSAGNTTISNIKVWHSVQAVPVYFDLGTAVAAGGGGGGDTPLWASSTVYTQASPASDFIINIKQLTGQALPTGTSPWSFQFTFETDDTTVGWSGTSFLGWGGGAYQAFDSVSCMIWDSTNYMVGNELQIEWQGNATQVAMVYCPDITDPVQHEAAWKGNASVGQPHGIEQYYSYNTVRYAGPLATTVNTSGHPYYNGAVMDYYIYQFGYAPAITGFATASHWNNHGHHTGNRYYYDENGVHTTGTPQPGEHTVFVSCDEGSGGTIAAFQHSRTVKVYVDGTHVATSVNTPANAGSAGQPADYLGICGAFINGYLKTHTGDAEGVNWGGGFRDRPATDNVPVNFYARPHGNWTMKDIKIWDAVVEPQVAPVNSATGVSDDWPGTYALTSSNIPRSGTITHATGELSNAPGSWATLDWAPVRMPFTIEFEVNVATFETFNHFFEFRDDDHTKNTIFCGPTSNNTIAIGGSSTYDAGGDDMGPPQQFLAATKTALSTNQDYAIKLTHDGEQVCVYVDDVKQEFEQGGAAADWQSTQVYNAPTALNLYGSDDTVTSGTAFNMPSGSDAYTIQFTYRKTNGWGGDGMMMDFGGTTAATTWAVIFNTAASWFISTWDNGDTSPLNLSQNFYGMGAPWNSQDWWTIRVTREQGTGARATKVYITKGEATDWTDASIVTALDTTLGEVPFGGDSNRLSIMNGANAYNNANFNQATAEMKDIKIWKGQVLVPEVQIFVGGNDYMSAVKSGIMFCGGPAQRSINTILGSSNSFYNTLGSQTIKSFKVTNSVSSGAVLTHSSDGMTNTAGNMATLKTPLVIQAPFALSTRVKFHTLQPLQHIFQFTNAAPYPATGDGTQNALSLGLTADNKFVFEGNTDGIFHSAITQTTAVEDQWYDLRVEHSGASGAVPTFLINDVAQSYDSLSPSADWSGLTGVFPAGGALPESATRLYHYIAGNATDFETSWNYGTMTVEHVTVADGFDMPVVTTITSNNDGTVKSETKMRETPGAYTLTYTAGVLSTTRAITVVDSSAPVFTDGNISTLTIERGHNYVETAPPVTDPGASGMGVPEPIATLSPSQSVAVDTSVVGDYARVFQATDGVHTVSHTRTVQVRDTVSPLITLLEPDAPDVYLAGPYTTATSLGSYSGADGPLNDTSGNAYTMPHGTEAYTIEFTFRSTTGEDNTSLGGTVSTFGRSVLLNWGSSQGGLPGISSNMVASIGSFHIVPNDGSSITFAHWSAPEPTLDLTTQYHGYTRTMQNSSDTSTGADDAIWWTIRATKSQGASPLLNVYVTQNGVWDATSIVPVVTDQSIGNPTSMSAASAARLGIMNGGNPFNDNVYDHTGTFAMKDIRIWKSVVVPTTGAASGADSSNPMVINAGQYTAWTSGDAGAEPGFTAIDTVDNTDLTSSVVVSGPNATDLATGGNYIVTYTLNASGDPAAYGPTVQKNRYVTVYEPPPTPTHYLSHSTNKQGHSGYWQTWTGTEGYTDYFYELPVLTSDKRTAYFWMGGSHSVARANFAIPTTGRYYFEITSDSMSGNPYFGVAHEGIDDEPGFGGSSTNVNAWSYNAGAWRRYGAANDTYYYQGGGGGPGNYDYNVPTFNANYGIPLGDFWSPHCMYAFGNSIVDCRRAKKCTLGFYVWQDAPEQQYKFGMQFNGSGPSEGAARLWDFGHNHGVNGAEVVYPIVASSGSAPNHSSQGNMYVSFPWPKPELFDNHETNDYFNYLGPRNLTQQHFPPHATNADDEEFTKGYMRFEYMFDAGFRHDKHHLHYVFAQVDGCTDENLIQPTDNPTGLSDDRLSINVTSSNGVSKWVAAFPLVPIPYMGQFYRFFDQKWIYNSHGGHADANNNQRYYMEVTVKSNTSRFFIGVVQHLPNAQHNHWQNFIVQSLNTLNAKQWDEAPLRWGWFIDIPNNTCHRVTTYKDGTTYRSEWVSDTGNSLMAGGAPQADDVIGMYFDFGDLKASPQDDRDLDVGQHFRVTKNGGTETVYEDFGQAIAQNQHVWTGRGYGNFERWPLVAGYDGTHLTCNFGPTFAHPPPNGTGEAYENNPFLPYSSLEHIYNHNTWKNFHGTNRWGVADSSYEACNVLPTIADGPLP